jgi:hypothetical protein
MGVRLPADLKLRVDADAHPGWRTGAEVALRAGGLVHCTEGPAEIVRILGKTGDGSRLLELRLPDVKRGTFFAAASNVLIAPED